MRKKIVVTGAAGYIGSELLRQLVRCEWVEVVVGLDLVPPRRPVEGVTYLQGDMLGPEWPGLIAEQRADALVHLAFVLNPMRDELRMREINVEGTRRTLEAAVGSGVKQLLCASSATAYGALPDNPLPLVEEDPIRGGLSRFQYARDKAELEGLYAEIARRHPGCRVAVVRPVIVFGPGVDNYLSRFIFAFPVIPLVGGGRTPLQLVHEEDVAGAMVRILEREAEGAFNVAAEEWLSMAELCRMAGVPAIPAPRRAVELALDLLWRTGRRVEAPGSVVDFIEHPWVVSTAKLQRELGYTVRRSGREAAREMLRARR
jgi:UDP-glucose 4-epimerase